MNKANLVDIIADKAGVSRKQAETMLDTLVETITSELLASRKVNIVGFGSFEARTRHARAGINPQHPTQKISIPEVKVAKFKTGKALKDALKGRTAAPSAPAVHEAEPATEETPAE